MGSLVYDKGAEIVIDDRVLAHLQVVILDKLRRSESFALECQDDRQMMTLWISETTPLEFRYSGNRHAQLNQAWLHQMAGEVGLHGVLTVRSEPPGPAG